MIKLPLEIDYFFPSHNPRSLGEPYQMITKLYEQQELNMMRSKVCLDLTPSLKYACVTNSFPLAVTFMAAKLCLVRFPNCHELEASGLGNLTKLCQAKTLAA